MAATPGTVRVAKELLAAGLFWQPAPTPAVAAREARIVAARDELQADLFCVRRRGIPQFGLGQKAAGHRPGMRAAAACLANAVAESSWLGVFATDSRWLLVTVRKGAIMPDGDLLFDSEAEAKERFEQELTVGGWDALFAPSAWQFAGARGEPVGQLTRASADARLQAVARQPAKRLAALAVILAAVAGGWGLVAPRPAAVPMAVPDVPVAPPPPPPPWQDKPKAGALIRACQTSIESARTVPGYEVETATCGAAGSTVVYRRRWGSLSWLPSGGAVTSPDRLSLNAALSGSLGRQPADVRPWPAETLRRRIWGVAQDYLLDSELAEAPARPPAAGQGPTFREVTVTLASSLPPAVLSGILEGIPAFVADEVSWQAMRWKVKGKAYVR